MEQEKICQNDTGKSNGLTLRELLDRITGLSNDKEYYYHFKKDLIDIQNALNITDDATKQQVVESVVDMYNNREATIQMTLGLYEKMFTYISKSEPTK